MQSKMGIWGQNYLLDSSNWNLMWRSFSIKVTSSPSFDKIAGGRVHMLNGLGMTHRYSSEWCMQAMTSLAEACHYNWLHSCAILKYFQLRSLSLLIFVPRRRQLLTPPAVNFLQNYAYVYISRHAKQQSPRQFRKNFEYNILTIKPNDCHLSSWSNCKGL